MIKIGKIVGAFGIKGEVKIYPMTNYFEMFFDFDEMYIESKNGFSPLHLTKSRIHKNTIVAVFTEIPSMDDVSPYLQKDIFVKEEQLPALEEGEHYLFQLLGMDVFTTEGEFLGRIEDVFDSGAHSVYVVKNGEREIMIPGIPSVIIEKDYPGRKMVVKLLPGLLDQ